MDIRDAVAMRILLAPEYYARPSTALGCQLGVSERYEPVRLQVLVAVRLFWFQRVQREGWEKNDSCSRHRGVLEPLRKAFGRSLGDGLCPSPEFKHLEWGPEQWTDYYSSLSTARSVAHYLHRPLIDLIGLLD